MIIVFALTSLYDFLFGKKRNPVYLLIYLASIISLVYILVWYGNTLVDQSLGEQSLTSGNSLKWRIIHWQYYINDIKNTSDLMFGFGTGAHEEVTNLVYNKYLEVHNDFLRMTYDIGILGVLLYIVIDVQIIIYCYKQLNAKNWFVIYAFIAKYFFMFFDNYVTNLMTVLGFYNVLILALESKNEKRSYTSKY